MDLIWAAFLALVFLAYVIVAPIVLFIRQSRARDEISSLTRKIAQLERRLAQAPAAMSGSPAPPEAEPASAPESRPGAEQPAPEPEPVTSQPAPTPDEEALGPWAAARTSTTTDSVDMRPTSPPPGGPPEDEPPPGPPRRSFEEIIAAQWMVWLGGATVALSAVFLFRYAVDQGLLTPFLRIVLGLILGGALLGAGEWFERRPIAAPGNAPDYVPPALTAAGIFAIFASIYAAHALFGLLGPGLAFAALGLTAWSALLLSLRQGWFVALLGILAGYLVPALIASPEANAVALFVFLLVLTGGALGVMVWRRWWWFAALTLVGAFLWPAIWLIERGATADQGVLSAYALGLAALFGALSVRLPLKDAQTPVWAWIKEALVQSAGLGFLFSGLLLWWIASEAGFNAAGFAMLAAYAAIALVFGLWRGQLESLAVIAAFVAVLVFVFWPQPFDITPPLREQQIGTGPVSNAFGPYVMPPEFHAFSRALWAFAALFGLGGFLALSRGRTPAVWAGLSAIVPVILFAVAYWRVGAFEVDIAWAGWAAALAGLYVLAAFAVARREGRSARHVPLAFYAAAAMAALALAFACLLREAWLTVALAAEITALGWVWTRLPVRELRPIAIAALGVVLIRLVANPMVLSYDEGFLGVFSWVIYGYGLPAALIFAAGRLFRRGADDLLVTLCEIAGAGLAALMVALQLKLWTSGSIFTPRWTLLDQATQVNWWLIAGMLLLLAGRRTHRGWMAVAGIGVLGFAGLLLIGGPLLASNPLVLREPVGSWPLFNLLGLAYLLPALLLGALALPQFGLPRTLRGIALGAAGVLGFVYLTLEIRRAFQGPLLTWRYDTLPSDAELYAYSAIWLVFALVLLALAILRQAQALRYASLAVLILTVAKVFLYDMSDLTGLFRVASFLGLGLVLIGIGHVYRRYVFTAPKPDSKAAQEPTP